MKCNSIARIVHEEGKFVIEHNSQQHSCDEVGDENLAKIPLSDQVIQEIRKLFQGKIRQPKQVLVSLRAINDSSDPKLFLTEPSKNQIRFQILKLKTEFHGKGEISLAELESFLKEHSKIPKEVDEAFVIGYKVTYADGDLDESDSSNDEENENENSSARHFWMLYSTKRLLQLASNSKLICCDTTFKFVWLGYPAILIGTVDLQKQFHPLAFGFTTAENSQMFFEAFDVSKLIFCDFYHV